MLTQSMPALTKALTGLIPPAAIRQLTQALGNCNQEVVQRGNVTMQPSAWTNANNGFGSGGPGTYSGNAWSPGNYQQLFNNSSTLNNNQYDLRTNIEQAGNTFYNSTGPTFQDFFNASSVNNYGGDVTNIGGNMIWGDTIINENPGSPGQAGRRGESGIDGLNGFDGFDGYDGEAGFDGLNGGDGLPGASGYDGEPGNAGANGFNGINGMNGINGVHGAAGRNGFGFNGAGGPQGQPGAAGVNGFAANGQNGLDGINGIGIGVAGRNGIDGVNGIGPDMRLAWAVIGVSLKEKLLVLEATVPKYTFDSNTCSLVSDGTDKVTFTPKCKQPLKKLTLVTQRQRFFRPNGP